MLDIIHELERLTLDSCDQKHYSLALGFSSS